ncbi:uncharacterized protein LOC111053018 isoform X4 [Nilaparvata lugens]|uniref:uncharacterized protein LOC111053018 isoform X4 n=1 Tax=Nilaparvata lugens TaxID=108931 RepID=UPI00193E7CFD|nr:uncharacterized protein LOC111053018 isoform X4 [Nilaparvata lugens]
MTHLRVLVGWTLLTLAFQCLLTALCTETEVQVAKVEVLELFDARENTTNGGGVIEECTDGRCVLTLSLQYKNRSISVQLMIHYPVGNETIIKLSAIYIVNGNTKTKGLNIQDKVIPGVCLWDFPLRIFKLCLKVTKIILHTDRTEICISLRVQLGRIGLFKLVTRCMDVKIRRSIDSARSVLKRLPSVREMTVSKDGTQQSSASTPNLLKKQETNRSIEINGNSSRFVDVDVENIIAG